MLAMMFIFVFTFLDVRYISDGEVSDECYKKPIGNTFNNLFKINEMCEQNYFCMRFLVMLI